MLYAGSLGGIHLLLALLKFAVSVVTCSEEEVRDEEQLLGAAFVEARLQIRSVIAHDGSHADGGQLLSGQSSAGRSVNVEALCLEGPTGLKATLTSGSGDENFVGHCGLAVGRGTGGTGGWGNLRLSRSRDYSSRAGKAAVSYAPINKSRGLLSTALWELW